MGEQSDTPRTGVLVPSEELKRLQRERDEARAEIERLRGALRGLHDDIVEYQRINHLGGYDNHWMLAAREALAATEAKR